jgi:hypothetical protein
MDRDRYGRSVAEVLLDSPQASNQCKRKCSKLGSLHHYKQYSTTVTTVMYLMPQKRSADRNNGECGSFRAAVSARGLSQTKALI